MSDDISDAVLTRLDRFAATKELGGFTDLEVRDLLQAYRQLRDGRSENGVKPHKILGQSLSDAELQRAFENVDVNTRCGACMEIFFTGSSQHQHSCNVGQGEFTHPWKGK